MSAGAGGPRVARVYTAARRHPWVLGKLGDWTIWFGPYTPAQLVVMGGGALLLIKTFMWWSWLGPVPVVMWLAAIWAVRGARIGGRAPFTAALGWLTLLTRHPAGQIGGRAARDRRPSMLRGSFVIEAAPADPIASTLTPGKAAGHLCAAPPSSGSVPVSGLTHLLEAARGDRMGRP